MKTTKINLPTRNKSNPPLKNLPPSTLLEEQTKKMEQRLQELKEVMAEQAAKRESQGSESGSRWQSATQNMPIKNYAETVLKNKSKDPIPSKAGKDNLKGTGTLPKPGNREKLSREQMPPLISPTGSNLNSTGNLSQKSNKENESQKDFFKGTGSGIPSVSVANTTTATNTTATTKTVVARPKKPITKPQEDEKQAENNINKALMKQKELGDVDKFLEEIGLPQYTAVFKEHGFDELETVMEIQTKHLVEMKIPAGHQIKLTKRIEQLRQTSEPAEKRAVPTPKASTNNQEGQINMEQIKSSTKANYVQLAEPTREQGIGEEKGGELLGGTFNEAESHKSFLEALNEWRSGNKPQQQQQTQAVPGSAGGMRKNRPKDSREKKVRFTEPVKGEEGKSNDDDVDYISSKPTPSKQKPEETKEDKKAFFFSGGSSWNQAEMPSQKETSTNMSPRGGQASQKAKVSCWHCYKLVNDDEAKSAGSKQFCSSECVKNFRDLNSTKCLKKGCNKTFLKEEGVLREGKWYCSENCAPSIEEILLEEQRMLKLLEKEGRLPSSREGSRGEIKGKQEESEENEEADEGKPEEIDLSVHVSNKKEVLTLAELEEKYKNLNKLIEEAQEGVDIRDEEAELDEEEGERNELEDSLN